MKYLSEIKLAIDNLQTHKLRTFLTMLGMIFGVGAVIAMLSIGAGAEQESLKIIDTMGVRNIIVKDREFKDEDLKKIRETSLGLSLRDVQAIETVVPDLETYSAKKKVKTFQIFSFTGKADEANVLGVTSSYFRLAKYSLLEGSFFSEIDEKNYEQFCVIGSRSRQKLFNKLSPIGKQIKINKLWFTVIGVLADNNLGKDEFEGVKLQDFSNDIYIPLTTGLKKFDLKRLESEVDEIILSIKSTDTLKPSAVLINQVLVSTHNKAEDFSIVLPRELLEQNQKTQNIFNIVMSCIAGIALLVGGIGIMNIMLANILERTREIGIRRAIGARRQDILLQFLMEALTISLVGGILGILFGFGASRLVALYADWTTLVTSTSIAMSFGVSASVGLVFGIYPAITASKLNPIEALRYE
ncbi:MAG: ABC transporter permease [Blastocatellia bacterium]|nr:ABC transporter permease [Blastocatellia bacterium]MBN8724024.1 ABC transporter permease [Acidobacteriota bacterium]